MTSEEVLVVPAARIQAIGAFHGFQKFTEDYRRAILDPVALSYRPRDRVETDPTFKQLIPYVVLRCGNEIFHYTRGSAGTEKRLQAKRSIGIGGHISRIDGSADGDPYRAGLLRELHEEVEVRSPWKEQTLGFIYDGRTPVGEVHIGIVHVFDLEDPLVWPRESAIDDAGFAPLKELLQKRDDFESWSQFAMEAISDRSEFDDKSQSRTGKIGW
jgi:predicted NUDIX family phosphoesterase